jgi:hypothetical protein
MCSSESPEPFARITAHTREYRYQIPISWRIYEGSVRFTRSPYDYQIPICEDCTLKCARGARRRIPFLG